MIFTQENGGSLPGGAYNLVSDGGGGYGWRVGGWRGGKHMRWSHLQVLMLSYSREQEIRSRKAWYPALSAGQKTHKQLLQQEAPESEFVPALDSAELFLHTAG